MTMTKNELDAILRADFMSFIERSFGELSPQTRLHVSAYLEVIASKLEACRTGKCKRLIICVPPRHLKSHAASVAFVAWLLGHEPAAHIICASYGQDLADDLARKCRTLMNTAFYQGLFPTRLSDRQALHDFVTTAGGTRMATSVGGVLTGRGGDYLIIDDPMKPDEALSETRRKSVNDWYDNTLLSRLNDKANGRIIIIMQRLHQDDLVGHVIEQEDWDVVSFPAIAEEDETHIIESPFGECLYHRRAGEVLDPTRESLVTLDNIKKTLGSYNFVSQYQQNPISPEGGLVKPEWFQSYDLRPQDTFGFTLLSLDTANKANELSDYTVGTIWSIRGQNFYLRHVYRKRVNYPELKRAVIELAKQFKVNRILIEDKASGTQLIQELKLSGIPGVTAYDPPSGTDKIMRFNAQTALIESGHVFLPAQASWREEYLKELTGFPGTKYDDQVDSTAQALDYLKTKCSLATWIKLGSMEKQAMITRRSRYI